MESSILLTLIIFIPLLGALLIAAMPGTEERHKRAIRWVTFGTLVLGLLVSLKLWFAFDPATAEMQFTERRQWIPAFGIEYSLGVDGLSVLLVLLTTFLAPLVMAGSWTAINDRVKGFCAALLVLQSAMLGAFCALDLFLFYVFWELMLIPLYFIIGIWGGKRRIYAAIKLFVYTMFGSLLMLIAVLYVAINAGTFDVLELQQHDFGTAQLWLFGFFALAFAIKVPMFPFHTWLPDAHVEAPTAGSVILAGVLLKMGTYGFVRFAMPMFPEAVPYYSPILCTLAVIGIVYGALVAMVQPDVKKLVAYSSVSHLGYVILGLFALNAQGVQGSILQMVNHGISTGGLFLLVGMIYERRHTRMIRDFGGLASVMPVYSFFFMVVTFSSIGLPGLNGFVGEMLILLGVFEFNKAFAIVAALGVILGAVYMLWMFRRVFFGPVVHEENRKLKDLNLREMSIMVALLVFIVWIGVYPRSFLSFTDQSVNSFVTNIETRMEQGNDRRAPTIRLEARGRRADSGDGDDEAEARRDRGRRGRPTLRRVDRADRRRVIRPTKRDIRPAKRVIRPRPAKRRGHAGHGHGEEN